MSEPPELELVGAEPVVALARRSWDHLLDNRALIIRRSLLSSALGAVIPIPVLDDYISGRVRAGLLMKLATKRHVDLHPSPADVLAEAKGRSAMRNATLTVAGFIAIKLAWRKFLTVLALGRGADEMATTFQIATLFDHYCARMHVGGPIDRDGAARLRRVIHATLDKPGGSALVEVFRDGSRVMGQSLLEAPRWITAKLQRLGERWIQTRGNAEATFDPAAELDEGEDSRWLDRATRAVEERLGQLGAGYLERLVTRFEDAWRASEAAGTPAGPSR